MTSFNSTGAGLEYALNKRHLPRSQVEAIPGCDSDQDDDNVSDTNASSLNPSSLRANFLLPGTEFTDPDPITIERYGSLRDSSSYFSPVFSHLRTVDPERLTLASNEVQTLRRKLMRGSNMLIIQGGYSGKRFVYDRLKELDVSVVILDGPDSVWRRAAEEGVISDFIELDFTDNTNIFERAMEAIVDSQLEFNFDACTTYFEDAVALAARIAKAMRIETNSVDACDKARNKRRTREVMAEKGLPVPKFASVLCEDDIAPACKLVGFPAILKPVFGAASMGVTRIESVEDAIASYRKLFVTFDVKDDTIWAQGTEMVIEEYYDGEEFDIDILLSDGEAVYSKVSDNWPCWEPWFQETGTNCPSLYPMHKQEELIKLSVDTTLSLGFKNGCFHVECRYTKRGPRLIEVNARMGGVSVRDANLFAWGIDLVEEHAMSALKIPIRPLISDTPLQFMAESALNAPFSGVINTDNWLDFALEDPRVYKVNYMMKKGDKVVGPEDGIPDWIAEIVVINKVSQEEGVGLIRSLVESRATVPITAKVPGSERGFFFPSHAFPFRAVKE